MNSIAPLKKIEIVQNDKNKKEELFGASKAAQPPSSSTSTLGSTMSTMSDTHERLQERGWLIIPLRLK
jgi:hypothetical protein